MPIYEFHCKDCSHGFKKLRPADAPDEVACPECGTLRVVRLLSVTAQTPAADDRCLLPAGNGCAGNPDMCCCRP